MSFAVNYMVGGRLDAPYFPTKTIPFIKGRRIGVYENIHHNEFIAPVDMEMIAFSIGASKYNDNDYWNLYINNEKIADEIYMKDVPEGFNFSVVKQIPAKAIIRFEYINKSLEKKAIWLNYQFLKD
ncbi:Low copy number virion structural protein [Bacillus sp. TH22]|uniref:Low copy number virion structural protein n=1 Tax=unclassified Bacillus (in: firmicutes) TaxID=185979 RepID=UPI001912BE0F|nr:MULTISPECIES: Low copy number virion structural protein [unclassified Bacillus (in: firmicutes)]MBK5452000.1 Low copy number virion structural protein [Bacillus sp. TH22]MBK5454263.1 Low copy number virion structural protein [Bacillus sp. TH23]